MKPPPAHAFVNRLIALTLLLLIFSGSLGLGAVWMRQEISQVANRSRALEGEMAKVERRLAAVNTEVATALNTKALLQQNEAMRLGLAFPHEIQVIRIDGSPERRLASRRNADRFDLASAVGRDQGNAPAFRLVTASLR